MILWGEPGFLTAGGKALEYRCFGPAPGDAPTLVLLHEGLGCAALWRDFPQRLAQATGCGVFVYSRQGYGASDAADLPRPLDYMTREALEVLPKVLDAFGFQKGALIGHSDGASIAAIHAGTVRDTRVTAAVLIAPHFFTEAMGLAAIKTAREAFETGDLAAKLGKYHRDVECAFRGWNDSWLHPDFAAWNVEDVLDTVPVPILAIQGSEDAYGTAAQVEVIAARSPSPVEVRMLEGAGHAPQLEQPEVVVGAIGQFLTKNAL